MTTAFVKIHSFINSLKDDEVIRATDQKLSDAEMKKNKNAKFDNNKGATHLYVRSGLLSKLRQALTSSTDGAIQKQHSAKELIITTLNNLPDDLKNEVSVQKSIKNITDTLKNNDLKDFTAGMIRKDLDVINNAFKFQNVIANPLYESKPVNPLYCGNSKESDPANRVTSDAVTAATPKVEKNVPTDGTKEPFVLKLKNKEISGGNVTEPVFNEIFDYFNFDSNDDRAKKAVLALTKEVLNNGNEEIVDSSVSSVDLNQIVNTSSKVVDKDTSVANIPAVKNGVLPLEDDEIPDGDDALSEVGSGSDSDDEDGAVSSSESELPSNETSSDPAVDGSPVEEPSSKPAESAPIINTIPTPIGEAIEQGADTAEAATENTPSPAPTARTSTAETKSTSTDNPYLESLKTEWKAKNGVYEVSKPFHITYEVPASHMIAQAYLLPVGRQLKLAGNTKKSSGEGSFVIKNAEAPKSTFVGGNKLVNNQRTAKHLDKIRTELFNIYLDTFAEIRNNYKKLNSGEELETLVIVPISALPETLADVESQVLASALHAIQSENPILKIAISADKDTHAAKIQSDYENIVSKSV